MDARKKRVHKHFRLDQIKLTRARKLMSVETETETIERALDMAISEFERNRLAEEANIRFATSGANIKDVYGKLDA
jgi:hypothetical protein